MRFLAVIPARGGSKRIANKNMREFCGVPIIKYSIEAAIESGCFTEVMVSTDSSEIAVISKGAGAEIPFLRSEKTSDDHAVLADVVEEVIEKYQEIGKNYDYICMILPTAPFISGKLIREGKENIIMADADSLVSIAKFSYPIQRAFRVSDKKIKMMDSQYINTRSQDLEPAYHDCGQFYWIKTESFLEQKKIFMDKSAYIEIPAKFIQDIDTEEDWEIAEIKYKIIKVRKNEEDK